MKEKRKKERFDRREKESLLLQQTAQSLTSIKMFKRKKGIFILNYPFVSSLSLSLSFILMHNYIFNIK